MKILVALSFLLAAAHADNYVVEECLPLPQVPHAYVAHPDEVDIGRGLGSYAYFKCNKPYTIIFPDKRYKGKTRCEGEMGNLEWKNVPKCVACGKPGAPEDGFISSSNADNDYFGVGEKVTWKCEYGFELDGASSATCLYVEGATSWSKPVPECVPITCDYPGDLTDGKVSPSGSIRVGKSYSYKCNRGFERVGPSSAKCQSSRMLDPEEFPECVPITCDYPGDLENGKVSPSGPIRAGKSYSYKCDRGYERVGPSSATCQYSGDLDPEEFPECIPITCEYPGDLEDGKVSPSGPIRPGKSYSYKCNRGFERVGPSSATCQYSGDLDPEEFPECVPITCDYPGDLENGEVSPSGPIRAGKSYSYQCDHGFKRVGPSSAKCQYSGELDPAGLPECRSQCKNPGAPKNGGIAPDQEYYDVGQEVTFCCNLYYIIKGTKKATCNKHGEWEPSIRVMCMRARGVAPYDENTCDFYGGLW